MTTLTSQPLASDFVRYMAAPEYCLEEGYIRNNTGSAIEFDEAAGYPVKLGTGNQYDPVLATDEANATHFVVERFKETIAASGKTVRKYKLLARGPAVVSREAIPTADYAGTNFTVATLVTAIEGLSPGVVVRDYDTGILSATPDST